MIQKTHVQRRLPTELGLNPQSHARQMEISNTTLEDSETKITRTQYESTHKIFQM